MMVTVRIKLACRNCNVTLGMQHAKDQASVVAVGVDHQACLRRNTVRVVYEHVRLSAG